MRDDGVREALRAGSTLGAAAGRGTGSGVLLELGGCGVVHPRLRSPSDNPKPGAAAPDPVNAGSCRPPESPLQRRHAEDDLEVFRDEGGVAYGATQANAVVVSGMGPPPPAGHPSSRSRGVGAPLAAAQHAP